MDTDLIQLGAVAILFLFAIKEFFSYLRSRKNSNGKKDTFQDIKIIENAKNIAVILQRLNTIESNHLAHISKELDKNRADHENIMAKLISIEALLKK